MKQTPRSIISFFLCLILVLPTAPAKGAASENKLAWTILAATQSQGLLLEVTGNSLPEHTSGMELQFILPDRFQVQELLPVFTNADRTVPEYYFKQYSKNSSLIVTVYCVNKINESFPANQPLFTLSLAGKGGLDSSDLKISYAKLVDSALNDTLYEINTLELKKSSGGDSGSGGGNSGGGGNNGGSGGGGGGGSDASDSQTPSGDVSKGEDAQKKRITTSAKKSSNKKTGAVTHTVTLTEKETGARLVAKIVYSKDGVLTKQQGSYYPSASDIKANGTTVKVSPKTPDTPWFDAIETLRKDYGLSDRLPIKLILPTAALKQTLQKGTKTRITLELTPPSWIQKENHLELTGILLEKSVWQTAQKHKKSLGVSIKGKNTSASYTWVFTKAAIQNSRDVTKSLNLLLKKKSSSQKLSLSFYENQPLPMQASLTLQLDPADTFQAGKKAYLYGYNSKTKKTLALAQETGYAINQKQQVTLSLTGLRDYILYPKKASQKTVTPLLDQISVTKKATLSASGQLVPKTAVLKLVMPDCILPSAKAGSITLPGAAYREAVVNCQSKAPSIVKVTKNGKITAKDSGTAVITTTITLPDKTSKTFRTKVTVTAD